VDEVILFNKLFLIFLCCLWWDMVHDILALMLAPSVHGNIDAWKNTLALKEPRLCWKTTIITFLLLCWFKCSSFIVQDMSIHLHQCQINVSQWLIFWAFYLTQRNNWRFVKIKICIVPLYWCSYWKYDVSFIVVGRYLKANSKCWFCNMLDFGRP
jgi:hypothetical protein